MKKNRSAKKPKTAKKAAPIKLKKIEKKPGKIKESREPARAPLRKIIGPGKTVSIVEPPRPVADEVKAPPRLAVKAKTESPVEDLPPKTAWDELPPAVPAQIRFLLKKASAECAAASDSPFPYAKFIASLPSAVCGVGLSIVILTGTQTTGEAAQICGLPHAKADLMLRGALSAIEERFYALCGETARKWKAQLTGSGIDLQAVIERYMVPKVDRSLQEMIGVVALRAIGARMDFVARQVAQ